MNTPSSVSENQQKELNLSLKVKNNYFLPLRLILTSINPPNFFVIVSNKSFTCYIFYYFQ